MKSVKINNKIIEPMPNNFKFTCKKNNNAKVEIDKISGKVTIKIAKALIRQLKAINRISIDFCDL